MPGNMNFKISPEEFLKNQRKNVKESKKEYEKKWDRASKEEEEGALKNYVENEVNLLKLELNLDLPEEFKSLDDAGQLMVLRDLKNRVVDIVKSDAQNQYSEYLKEKTETKLGNLGKSLKNALSGGLELQKIEKDVFEKIKNDEEGKKLIQENLELLTKITKDKNLEVDSKGNVLIKFLETKGLSGEEWDKVYGFNVKANTFRNMPYEWGQIEKKNKILSFFSKESKNKKVYDEAKEQYDLAREEILNIKSKFRDPKVGEKAIIEMLEIDNSIKMDQVLNTHPEFQVELEKMTEGTSVGRWMKDSFSNSFKGVALSNKVITGLGVATRMTAKYAATLSAATGITAIAAPLIGAGIGAVRGKIKAKETLKENKKQSRYGKEDGSKEKINMTDIDHLSKQLNVLIEKVNNSKDNKEKSENLAMLHVRIQHTKGKMEKGEVNFGDAKSALVKQYNIVNSLNEAILLMESNTGDINKEVENRINYLVLDRSTKTNEEVKEKQEKFIKKQWKKSALIGAGFATAGYIARWAGEELGWWGHTENVDAKSKINTEEVIKKVKGPKATDFKKVFGEGGIDEKDLRGTQDTLKTSIDTTKVVTQTDTLSKDSVFAETKVPTDSTMEKTVGLKDTLKSPVDTTQATETPTETIKKVTKKGAEKLAELKKEIAGTYPRGAQMDFAVTLGKNGVPKNLETAFSEIAADHMAMPTDGIVNEKFATKSLNISANLVELTKGHHVAHIDTEEFKNAFNFNEKTGEFEIKDHEKFNEILGNLEKHADEQWENGNLQNKGGAISYISKIKGDSWLKIVHADGMHENIDGDATGIEGHQDVTIDKIKNFAESDMVKKASIDMEGADANFDDVDNGVTAEDLMSDAEKAARTEATEQELLDGAGNQDNTVTEEDLMSTEEKAGLVRERGFYKHSIDATQDTSTVDSIDGHNEGPYAEESIPRNEASAPSNEHGTGNTDHETGNKTNHHERTLTSREVRELKELDDKISEINDNNLNKIFNNKLGSYYKIKDNTADDMLKIQPSMEGLTPGYKNFFLYIRELHEKTGLEPKHEILIPPTSAETIDEYIKRALKEAQRMKMLKKLEL